MRETVPLSERKIDVVFIAFWVLNLTFITYIVDLEQIVIDDPANFDFAAKYRRGSTVPIGATEFQFQAAVLDFHSTTYEWLVVVGPLAKFKGEGEINGEGGYGFMLSAIDGARPGGGGLDKVRIKIWDKASGMVVYDNQIGAGDDEPPTTVIGGGSIVVHRRHRKHSNRMHAAGP